jgi:membrane protein required for colicin V production
MSLIDIVLLLPLAYGSWRGFKSGFILGVFSLLAIVVGIYVAVHFSDMVSDFFIKNVGGYSSAPAFAFTFTFLVVGAAVYFGGVTLEGLLKASNLSFLNRLVGLVFGFLTSVFILSVILLNYQSYDPNGKLISQKARNESLLYYPLQDASLRTIPYLKESRLYLEGKLVSEDSDASEVENF